MGAACSPLFVRCALHVNPYVSPVEVMEEALFCVVQSH